MKIVTIDGPAGVGKSTVSRQLAAQLGYTYLDTGAMYRAVALGCHQAAIDPKSVEAVAALLPDLDITLLPAATSDEETPVLLNGEAVSQAIRKPAISMLSSVISAHEPVRRRLTHLQQALGQAGKLVAEGRDTGTVVFPQARWKFFLSADPGERARRRVAQLKERGEVVAVEVILEQIHQRDHEDQVRALAPLVAAKEAVMIDSTHLDLAQVLATMQQHIDLHG